MSYTEKALRYELRKPDFKEYSRVITKETVDVFIKQVAVDLAEKNYIVEPELLHKDSENRCLFMVSTLQDVLVLRRANTILRRFISPQIFNRNEEIQQLASLVKREPRSFVFRTDISSFFESISFRDLIKSLRRHGFNNIPTLKLLYAISEALEKEGQTGVPRGLSISSTLADYSLKSFDDSIRRSKSYSYYSRYVDDIVLLSSEDTITKDDVEKKLPEKMELNNRKTEKKPTNDNEGFDFLGYNICLKETAVHTTVSNSKIDRCKTRIILSLKDFCKNKNYQLLKNRLLFLSTTTKLRKSGREKPALVGFKHSYRLAEADDTIRKMEKLDHFLYGVLKSKRYSLARRVRQLLTQQQTKDLTSISFKIGFTKNIRSSLKPKEIKSIKRAWVNEKTKKKNQKERC